MRWLHSGKVSQTLFLLSPKSAPKFDSEAFEPNSELKFDFKENRILLNYLSGFFPFLPLFNMSDDVDTNNKRAS